jgi:threonine dehydrogenase-like Zn-dependent dehydrogenase
VDRRVDPSWAAASLADVYDRRRNNFDALRFGLASAVICPTGAAFRTRRGFATREPRVAHVDFTAPEYQPDGSIRPTRYAFDGSEATGWEVLREGARHLELGPGYRLLAASHCGVCATDLARRHLPFRLPQVTGHEVVAEEADGTAVVVEINASHAARALPHEAWCAHCRSGLPTHCPARLVLGIHDLPGGFGPWLLAPTNAVVPLGAGIDRRTSALVEPFASALHAVRTIAPRAGDRIAVVGPGRLGTLVVAALVAWRAAEHVAVEIVAVGRRDALLARARSLGADEALRMDQVGSASADVVVETTGSPDGLSIALGLARREVHVKSTTGQPTLGLRHLTELVVDEVSLAPLDDVAPATSVVLAPSVPAAVGLRLARGGARIVTAAEAASLPLGAADAAVVTSLVEVDAMIRPHDGVEQGLVRARGRILVADGDPSAPLMAALVDRRLVVSTSRCGDLRDALTELRDPRLGLGTRLGDALVAEVLPAERLADAFARAAAGGAKVVVTHPGGAW